MNLNEMIEAEIDNDERYEVQDDHRGYAPSLSALKERASEIYDDRNDR